MQCPKCNNRMEVQDTKNYKSYDSVPDIPEQKFNNYDHRWHWCPVCGSILQTAGKIIPGTFVEGTYEDYTKNLPLFNKQNNSNDK